MSGYKKEATVVQPTTKKASNIERRRDGGLIFVTRPCSHPVTIEGLVNARFGLVPSEVEKEEVA